MKKYFNRIFAVSLMAMTASFVGCSENYDDEIGNLNERVTALESTVKTIQDAVNKGATISGVTSSAEGVVITLSNGETYTITNGKDGAAGTVAEIKDGNWWINGVDSKVPATGEAGTTPHIGTNGNWFIGTTDTGVAASGGTAASSIIATVNADGTVTIAGLVDADGKAIDPITIGSANGVSSLEFVPEWNSALYGDIVYMPVIVDSEKNLENVVAGWANLKYRVNASTVDPTSIKLNGVATSATKQTKATYGTNLCAVIDGVENSVLTVKASIAGYNTIDLGGSATGLSGKYDDPATAPNVPAGTMVDQLRTIIDNTNNDAVASQVTSEYTAFARQAIETKDILSQITVGVDRKDVTPARDLQAMYAEGSTQEAIDAYLVKLPIHLNVDFKGEFDLRAKLLDVVKAWYTNTDYSSTEATTLAALGFDNVNFEIVPQMFNEAEVNQSKYLIESDLAKGIINFRNTQAEVDAASYEILGSSETAAISREPVVKVILSVTEPCSGRKVVVAENLIKMLVVNEAEVIPTTPVTTEVMTTFTQGCAYGLTDAANTLPAFVKNPTAPNVLDPRVEFVSHWASYDFDNVFNALNVSKQRFIEIYGEEVQVKVEKMTGTTVAEYVHTAAMYPNVNDQIFVPGSTSTGNIGIAGATGSTPALDNNNNLVFAVQEQVLPGKYRFVITATKQVGGDVLTITDRWFEVVNPSFSVVRNTVSWNNMLAQFNVLTPKVSFDPANDNFKVDLDSYYEQIAGTTSADKVNTEVVTENPVEPILGNNAKINTNIAFYFNENPIVTLADAKTVSLTRVDIKDAAGKITSQELRTAANELIATLDVVTGIVTIAEVSNVEGATSVRDWLTMGNFVFNKVELVTEYCNEPIDINIFDVEVIQPLELKEFATNSFEDAVNFGSELKYTEIINMNDWRGATNPVSVPGIAGNVASQLGEYYAVVTWDGIKIAGSSFVAGSTALSVEVPKSAFANIKTNLVTKVVGGETVQTPDNTITFETATTTLPTTVDLTLKRTAADATGAYTLNYVNNGATVKEVYTMWIPVAIEYKWGVLEGHVAVKVYPNGQLPTTK